MKKSILKTSIIIPNWNGKHLLGICLTSLKKQTYKQFETIVVDNGSKDGSVEYIQKYYPWVKLIESEKNYGFAKAINLGINEASGDYIVLINNDTKIDKNCIKYLVNAAAKHIDVGFVAAKMLNFDNQEIIDSAGDYINTVGHADNIGRGEKDGEKFNSPGYLFLATGGGSLFKKWLFDKVGLFDEDYFAYMEDVDLCFRAQLQGVQGWFEPKARIFHIHKATSSKNPSFLEYLQFRNMTQTIIKNFPKTLLLRNLNWLKIILVNINTIIYLTKKGYGLSAIRAEIYILMNMPKLLRKRKYIQQTKSVSDEYIIENVKVKKLKLPFIGNTTKL